MLALALAAAFVQGAGLEDEPYSLFAIGVALAVESAPPFSVDLRRCWREDDWSSQELLAGLLHCARQRCFFAGCLRFLLPILDIFAMTSTDNGLERAVK